MKYRKKPVVIEAVRLTWKTWSEVCEFLGIERIHETGGAYPGSASDTCGEKGPFINLDIQTLEGRMTVRHGDWVIRGVHGEVYPCKPDIFAATYEPVEST